VEWASLEPIDELGNFVAHHQPTAQRFSHSSSAAARTETSALATKRNELFVLTITAYDQKKTVL
jgi:hypothetical protein